MINCVSLTFSLIIILIIRPVVSQLGASKSRPLVCDTDQCRAVSEIFEDNIDPEVKPCDDFYEHVCGKFAKTTVPNGTYSWFYMEYINRIVQEKLIGYLSKPRNKRESDRIKWAKGQFQACMNTRRLDKMGIKPLMDEVNKRGNWSIFTKFAIRPHHSPLKKWVQIHDTYNRLMGKGGLFTIGVKGSSVYKRNVITVHITKDLFRHTPKFVDPNDTKMYTEFLIDMSEQFRNLCCNDSVSAAHMEVIDRVIQFRVTLTKTMADTSTTHTTLCTTVDSFQKLTVRAMGEGPINWLHLLRSTFNSIEHVKIEDSTSICVEDIDVFLETIKIIGNTSEEVIMDHLHFYFLENYMEYSDTRMYQLYQRMHMKVLSPRSIACISERLLARASNSIYLHHFLPEHTMSLAENVILDVRLTLADEISRTKWLDKVAKRIANENLDNMYRHLNRVGWDKKENDALDYYSGLSITNDYLQNVFNFDRFSYFKKLSLLGKNKNSYRRSASSSVAYRDHQLHTSNNEITELPITLHELPFLGVDLPHAINYGAFGTIYGQSLSDVFYTTSNRRRGHVTYTWSFPSWRTYLNRLLVYSQRIDTTVHEEFFATEANFNIDLKLYIEQAAIQYVGLVASFEAYRKRMSSERRGLRKLLHLKDADNDKLFFIAYAMSRCEAIDVEKFTSMLKKSDKRRMRLPHRFSVNAALSNMRAFSEAFKCTINDFMNSSNKIEFFDEAKIYKH